MRRPVNLCSLLLIAGSMAMNAPAASVLPTFRIAGANDSEWANIFASIGIQRSKSDKAEIVVAGGNGQADLATIADDHLLIIEGNGALAQKFGIAPDAQSVLVRRVIDSHAPEMKIIWEEPLSIPLSHVPNDFHVFAREHAKNAPLIAGKRTAHGAVLWVATEPGRHRALSVHFASSDGPRLNYAGTRNDIVEFLRFRVPFASRCRVPGAAMA
jgi:hypothetical protein